MVGIGIATALGLSFLWSLAALRFGPQLGFVDQPDDPSLKVHSQAAVPLGGVGVLLAVGIGWWVAGGVEPKLVVVASALTLLGLVDDRRRLSPWLRLVAQVAVAIVTVAYGLVPLTSSFLEAAVAVGLIVVSINAVNLFDGLDGLAGSVGLITALGIGALASVRGNDPNLALIVAAGLGGFLILNRPPARVFLGDNGAYLVGFLLAVALMRASPTGLGIELAVAAVMLGVFVLDLVVTVIRRGLGGHPLFIGDRSHLYDQLIDRGWSVGLVVMAAVILQSGFVGLALLLEAAMAR